MTERNTQPKYYGQREHRCNNERSQQQCKDEQSKRKNKKSRKEERIEKQNIEVNG